MTVIMMVTARNNKVLADGRRVKPVAGLHIDQWLERFSTIFRPLLLPDLPDAFDITLHKVGGIRLTAVGNHRIGATSLGRAICWAKSTGITTSPRMRPACIFSISS